MAEEFCPVEHIYRIMSSYPSRYWGLRVVDEKPEMKPHEIVPNSRVWRNGTPTSRSLSGASAVDIESKDKKHIKTALDRLNDERKGYYFGEHVMLIHGKNARRGEDEGERVISNARLAAHYMKPDAGPGYPNKVVSSVETKD